MAGRGLDHAGAAALIQFGVGSTLADNYVLLVDSAEAMDKAAADKMLRDLERPAMTTTVILLADNIGKLPSALLSRCEKWRADTLDIFQSRRFVDDLCARESLKIPARLQQFAALAGGGSPSTIRGALLRLDRQRSSTLEEAKAAFDLTHIFNEFMRAEGFQVQLNGGIFDCRAPARADDEREIAAYLRRRRTVLKGQLSPD